jgi:DNA-binding GntR family transcriptional regulator
LELKAMEIPFRTKNEAVYENLRRDILQGKIRPGERIVVSELSKQLGFSEIPIREGIKKLESEGFLRNTPHVGITVSTVNPDEIMEFYLIRIELEALAARMATPKISDSDLEYLSQINQEMELALKENDCEALASLNKKFHLRIYRAASRPNLYKMICELWDKINWIRSVFFLTPQIALESLKEHKELIEALKKRDVDLVDKLTRQQKQNSLKAIADRFF